MITVLNYHFDALRHLRIVTDHFRHNPEPEPHKTADALDPTNWLQPLNLRNLLGGFTETTDSLAVPAYSRT